MTKKYFIFLFLFLIPFSSVLSSTLDEEKEVEDLRGTVPPSSLLAFNPATTDPDFAQTTALVERIKSWVTTSAFQEAREELSTHLKALVRYHQDELSLIEVYKSALREPSPEEIFKRLKGTPLEDHKVILEIQKRVSGERSIRRNLEYLSFLNPYFASERPPLLSFVFMYEYFIQTPFAYRADLSGGRLKDFKREDFDPLATPPTIAPYLFAPELFLENSFYAIIKGAKPLGEVFIGSLNRLSGLFMLHRDVLPKAFFGLSHSHFYAREFIATLGRAVFSLADQQEAFAILERLEYKKNVTRNVNSYLQALSCDEKTRYFSSLDLTHTSFYDFCFTPSITPTEEERSLIYQNAYKVLTIEWSWTRSYKKGRTPLHLVAERAQRFKEDPHYKAFFDPTSPHFRFNNRVFEEKEEMAGTSGGGGGGGGASCAAADAEDDWGIHQVVGASKKKGKKTPHKKGKSGRKSKERRSRSSSSSSEEADTALAQTAPREDESIPEERRSPMHPLAREDAPVSSTAEVSPEATRALFEEILSHTGGGVDSQHALAHILGLDPGAYEVRKGDVARDTAATRTAIEEETEARRHQTQAWLQKNFSTKQRALLLSILRQDIHFAKYQDVVNLFTRFTGAQVHTKSGSHRNFMFRPPETMEVPEPRLVKLDEFVEPHGGGAFGPAAIRDAATMFTHMLKAYNVDITLL